MIKGMILAGGAGTRLYPATSVVSKQLLPVYDKPMIYYPLSILMLAGIREILLISTPEDTPRFQRLLGDGSRWGISLKYAVQARPGGIAEAYIIGEAFLNGSRSALVLGDNLFFGNELSHLLQEATAQEEGATIFAYPVTHPEQYGVVEFDAHSCPVSIEEKPLHPKSRYAVTGLYFYDNRAVEFVKQLTPSGRCELEITDLNRIYLKKGQLDVKVMSRGMAWLDTGTFDSLLDAALFIQTIQRRQGLKIACLEEIAYRMGYITADQVEKMARSMDKNSYGSYLLEILEEGVLTR